MISELNFRKVTDGTYEATFISTGKAVVELERRKSSEVWVRASIPDMEDVSVAKFNNEYGPNILFEVRQPAGIEVTVRSRTEVTRGKVLVRDRDSGDIGGGDTPPSGSGSISSEDIDSIIDAL